MINRTLPPEFRTISRLTLPATSESKLANGISVTLLPAGSEPVYRIDLVFDAGSRYQDIIFQSSLTSQMIPEGTESRSGADIAEEFEFYGCYFNNSADRDEADLTLHTLARHLDPSVALLAEIISRPSFPEKELGIIRANRIESMKVDDQRVESLARKEFNRRIFGVRHPYGVIGEIEHMSPVTPDHLKQFHSRHYTPENCRILVTGPEPGICLPILEKHLGGTWGGSPSAGFQKPELPEFEPFSPVLKVISRPDAVQTALRIGRPLFNRNHPDALGFSVVNTILGGYFGSRLMSNIREEKGLTYGISSHVLSLRDGGYFVVSSTVGADKWQEAVREISNEMRKLAGEPVGPDEMALVRNYLTGQIQRSVDGPFPLAEQLRALWLNGLGLDYLSLVMETVSKITPVEILELAARYLDPDAMTVVAAGPVQNPD